MSTEKSEFEAYRKELETLLRTYKKELDYNQSNNQQREIEKIRPIESITNYNLEAGTDTIKITPL